MWLSLHSSVLAGRLLSGLCAIKMSKFETIVKSIACEKAAITTACFLCNTRRKTRETALHSAVPLLPVQGPSVILTLRRRGASRGRPVLGGSLKFLAFSRVSEGAKRLSGELGDKGTNLRVLHPADRNLP